MINQEDLVLVQVIQHNILFSDEYYQHQIYIIKLLFKLKLNYQLNFHLNHLKFVLLHLSIIQMLMKQVKYVLIYLTQVKHGNQQHHQLMLSKLLLILLITQKLIMHLMLVCYIFFRLIFFQFSIDFIQEIASEYTANKPEFDRKALALVKKSGLSRS